MAEPFIAEIRLFSYDRVPQGWQRCEGQTLSIAQNQALFSLLGNAYGGDGVTIFALPDLRGRVPVHPSPTVPYGSSGGEAAHTLTEAEMPAHTHTVAASDQSPVAISPEGQSWSALEGFYGKADPLVPMNGGAIAPAGGGQPHENMQPYLALSFCIATVGIYPSRN